MKDSYNRGLSFRELVELFEKVEAHDMNPWTGRVFTHIYDHGNREYYEYARGALLRNYDKTMLDFTVYPSIVFYERDLAKFLLGIFNGGSESAGSFTYGGTESIFLAVKSAREYYKSQNKNKDTHPEIVLPETAHPAFRKAAHYLGLRTVEVRVDREKWIVDPEDIRKSISEKTALVVASAPNYPYGTVDPVEEIAEITSSQNIWLHIDACLGGMILPFLKQTDPSIPDITFNVDGVYSISVDMHKFGYGLKGSSMILYRHKNLRLHQIYVNASWPGYPIVNPAVLSTRSAGPLVAAWTMARVLGYEGYRELAMKIARARDYIAEGINNTEVLEVVGEPKAGTLAFTSKKKNIFHLNSLLRKKGWILQSQPGNRHLGYPPSLHMTISPIHEGKIAEEFIRDLSTLAREAKDWNWQEVELLAAQFGLDKEISPEIGVLMGRMVRDALLNPSGEGDDSLEMIDLLIYWLEPEKVEQLLKIAVNEIFS